MIDELRRPDVRAFILAHENDDPAALALQAKKHPDLPIPLIAAQIQLRQKAKSKLPDYYQSTEIIYPLGVSLEQSSSQVTAKYKSQLINGHRITDLTAGFGVDTYWFSKSFQHVHHVENNELISQLAQESHNSLNSENISHFNLSAEEYLRLEKSPSDYYYIDPARRDARNNRVFSIKECLPDITSIIPTILAKKSKVLVKLSPMLDIRQALQELTNIKEVQVIAVRNECKELLLLIEPNCAAAPHMVAVNISSDKIDRFEFSLVDEKYHPTFSEPLTYLYEPNAAIMKAGGFNAVARQYGLNKLNRNSHLYTSETIIDGFPGRVFVIDRKLAISKKEIKMHIPSGKANIAVRNYPLTVADIRKKTKIKEGGDVYLFATTLADGKPSVLLCNKLA